MREEEGRQEEELGPGIERDPEIERLLEAKRGLRIGGSIDSIEHLKECEWSWMVQALECLLRKHPKRYRARLQEPGAGEEGECSSPA